jgi:hypothetical protein
MPRSRRWRPMSGGRLGESGRAGYGGGARAAALRSRGRGSTGLGVVGLAGIGLAGDLRCAAARQAPGRSRSPGSSTCGGCPGACVDWCGAARGRAPAWASGARRARVPTGEAKTGPWQPLVCRSPTQILGQPAPVPGQATIGTALGGVAVVVRMPAQGLQVAHHGAANVQGAPLHIATNQIPTAELQGLGCQGAQVAINGGLDVGGHAGSLLSDGGPAANGVLAMAGGIMLLGRYDNASHLYVNGDANAYHRGVSGCRNWRTGGDERTLGPSWG